MKILTTLLLFLSFQVNAQNLSYGWYGPITPESQTIDVQFTQSGTLLVKLNGVDDIPFIPYGMTNSVIAYPVTGSGTLRITVLDLNAGLSATNLIHVDLVGNNNTTIGWFELGCGSVGCPQVYVFEQTDMYFTSDPVNPNNLYVDKPVYAGKYKHTQVGLRENRVYYKVTEPDGGVIYFSPQVADPLFTPYEEMHFPFWAFETGNYEVCAWYNHADIGLPSNFPETNIIPNLCLTFPHNGLSTSLDESHFEELKKNGLFVWPNPVTDAFKVTSAETGPYIVTNVMGQTMQMGQLVTGDNTFDASSWPSGTYIVSLVNTGHFAKVMRQ